MDDSVEEEIIPFLSLEHQPIGEKGEQQKEEIHRFQTTTSSTSSAYNFFPLLPYELMLYIFKHLTMSDLGRAAQVCGLWKQCAYDPSLYKKLDLYPFRRGMNEQVLDLFLNRVEQLEDLNLTYALNVEPMDGLIELIATRFANTLVHLDVTDCSQFTDKSLFNLEGCFRLKSLVLTGCKITPKALLKFSENCSCSGLETLQISSIKGLKEKDIQLLKQYFTNAKIIWRIDGNKILFFMEPCPYSSLRPLQYSKLSCKTGLRLRSFYRYIVLKLGISDENRFAEDIIDILYQGKVLSPTVTLEEAIGSWPTGEDKTVTLRYRRKTERKRDGEEHEKRKKPSKKTKEEKEKVVEKKKDKHKKDKEEKEGCILM